MTFTSLKNAIYIYRFITVIIINTINTNGNKKIQVLFLLIPVQHRTLVVIKTKIRKIRPITDPVTFSDSNYNLAKLYYKFNTFSHIQFRKKRMYL